MKIKTIVGKKFDELCFELASNIIDSNYNPDIVIGIKNGGDVVGKKVFKYLKMSNSRLKYFSISTRHKSTNNFEKINLGKFLQYIPNFLLNIIRIVQIITYEKLFDWFKFKRKYDIDYNIDKELIHLMHLGNKKILIIDDAIDSGLTMQYTLSNIKIKGLPRPRKKSNEIKIAVATVTYSNPIIKPDYQLYNKTIIRFPWALDAKQK